MMEGLDFIITRLQPWDIYIGCTIKITAIEISKRNRVLYINTPLSVKELKKHSKVNEHRLASIKNKTGLIRKVNDNLWVADCPFFLFPVGKLPTAFLFDFVNKRNNVTLGKYIASVAHDLEFNDYIHLIDTDIYRSRYLKQIIKPAISIYYCRDFVINGPYWQKHGKRVEDALAASADIVLANSTYFAERFRKLNNNTHAIETGVNLDVYDGDKEYAVPQDISSIGHPIVGYVGSLTAMRLDIPLLEQIAWRCPTMNFVFVGPEDEAFKRSRLHECGNVHFLGQKSTDEVPAYINAFDVCINPQLVNDMTIGNYPLKADEYLAMGKPMVATVTHTMRDVFGAYTHLAEGCDDYVSALHKAVKEVGDDDLRKKRIAFARTHSWENSVKKIYCIIENYEAGLNQPHCGS